MLAFQSLGTADTRSNLVASLPLNEKLQTRRAAFMTCVIGVSESMPSRLQEI